MGVSSDAMIYFGFPIGDADEPPSFLEGRENEDDIEESFSNMVCEVAGLPANATYKERQAVIEACPAQIHSYCSYEWSMYLLCIRGAEYSVSRGYTQEITPEMLTVAPDKIAAFKAWCKANNIEWQEPRWLLCSMYG